MFRRALLPISPQLIFELTIFPFKDGHLCGPHMFLTIHMQTIKSECAKIFIRSLRNLAAWAV